MKKHNLAEFFKSKSFYALLCVGALAIVVITMVGLNQSSEKEKNNNLVDLNEPISDVADGEDNSNQEIGNVPDTNNTTPSTTANNEEGISQTEVTQGNPDKQGIISPSVTDGSLLESDIYDDPLAAATNDELIPDAITEDVATESEATQTVDTGVNNPEDVSEPVVSTPNTVEETKPVMKLDSLFFEAETGLLWPVAGNVLMNYSADRVIYFETLEQFKCNPAVIIDAKVGTEVLGAAQGIVTSITNDDVTGWTITASIGSGYSLVYGQLENVAFEVGDVIEEGVVLGTIAQPTKYYSVEGSNLYFQVIKDEETVNPMQLLR